VLKDAGLQNGNTNANDLNKMTKRLVERSSCIYPSEDRTAFRYGAAYPNQESKKPQTRNLLHW
jgi:hypothetical protein